jgi:hypothetical protein
MTELKHGQAAPSRATMALRVVPLALLLVIFIAAVGRPGSVPESTRPKTTTRPAPIALAHFSTLPPGSNLPTGAWCSRHVRQSSWEPRPENFTPNHTTGYRLYYIEGANETARLKFGQRVDGNFTGTTDEIIQWGACKWGLDEDVLRAQAVVESNWYQSAVGDGGQSFGLLQIKASSHPGTFPASRDSTAFNVDYAVAFWRLCYEGQLWWPSSRGDLWGCIGSRFSGGWRDAKAKAYVNRVQTQIRLRRWTRLGRRNT